MTKYEALLQQFNDALERFQEVLKEEKNEFIRDSAIKRFELVFDLSWKTVKAFLEKEGIKCTFPRDCFREAYRGKLIDYDDVWMKMIDTRNYTVHTYSEVFAEEIYAGLPKTLTAFQKLLAALKKQGLNTRS